MRKYLLFLSLLTIASLGFSQIPVTESDVFDRPTKAELEQLEPNLAQDIQGITDRNCETMSITEQIMLQYEQLSPEEQAKWLRTGNGPSATDVSNNGIPVNQDCVIYLPVVVHLFHDGDAVNTVGDNSSTNLSAAQVYSGIDRMNDDFRRFNEDRALTARWDHLAADMRIEFVPVEFDLMGNPMAEPGIVRWNTNDHAGLPFMGASYTTGEMQGTVKPYTIWDRTKAVNIWLPGLGGGLLGYAQFPDSDLPGLGFASPPDTDGVVVGNGQNTSCNYNLNNCDDTAFGAPVDLPNMIENYMDYTSDECMNLFTWEQKGRQDYVFINSPGRVELLQTSTLITYPDPAAAVGFDFAAMEVNEAGSNAVDCMSTVYFNARLKYCSTGGAAPTADLVFGGTATEGEDYVILDVPSSLTFDDASMNDHLLSIALIGDGQVEGDETIEISLEKSSNFWKLLSLHHRYILC